MKEISTDKVRLGLQELEREQNKSKYEHNKHKLGRILTVIDGCIGDAEQRKAVKDLLQSIWYEDGAINVMNNSHQSLLFEALTGEKLWDDKPAKKNQSTFAQAYNPFIDKLK